MRGRLRWPRQSPGWRWPCRLRTWRAWCLWPKIKIILKLYNNKINIFGFLRFQYWLLSSHLSPSSSGPWWPPSAPAAPCSSPCGPIRGEHVVTWPGLHQSQLTWWRPAASLLTWSGWFSSSCWRSPVSPACGQPDSGTAAAAPATSRWMYISHQSIKV